MADLKLMRNAHGIEQDELTVGGGRFCWFWAVARRDALRQPPPTHARLEVLPPVGKTKHVVRKQLTACGAPVLTGGSASGLSATDACGRASAGDDR